MERGPSLKLSVCHPSHHVVDLLDSQTDISGLQACGEVGLQQGSVVYSLVEVVALNLWSVLWYGVSVSVDIPRYLVDVACHILWEKEKKKLRLELMHKIHRPSL